MYVCCVYLHQNSVADLDSEVPLSQSEVVLSQDPLPDPVKLPMRIEKLRYTHSVTIYKIILHTVHNICTHPKENVTHSTDRSIVVS